jgi:hypothetical protein
MSSYLAVVRNWSYMTQGVIAVSPDLNELVALLSQKIGSDLTQRKNLITDKAYLPYVKCVAIYDLSIDESDLICQEKDNCWNLYIIECSGGTCDIDKCFREMWQANYWTNDDESNSDHDVPLP